MGRITRAQWSRKGLNTEVCCLSFCTSRKYHYTLSDQAVITLQLRVSISKLVKIFLAGQPLLRWGPEIFFSPMPKPSLRGQGTVTQNIIMWRPVMFT
jgi:hypothetical protein